MNPQAIVETLVTAGMSPRLNEPVAKLGFWRLGGPADVFVDVENAEGLAAVMGLGVPVTVIGKGSNLLVADAGIRGLTVRLVGAFRSVELGADDRGKAVADVGGGVLNTVLLKRLAEAGLGGGAALAGVPGTMGGAVRMNAGTRLGEIGERIVHVDVVQPGGGRQRLFVDEIGFAYRRARLPAGAVVVGVRLNLLQDAREVDAEAADMTEHLAHRKATQPLDQPSCGSVFKNPEGDHAGRLIEAAGLKGAVLGGAQISEKHANFIVNRGGATAMDVLGLVRRARDTVARRFGIALEPEVHAVGDWPEGSWPL